MFPDLELDQRGECFDRAVDGWVFAGPGLEVQRREHSGAQEPCVAMGDAQNVASRVSGWFVEHIRLVGEPRQRRQKQKITGA